MRRHYKCAGSDGSLLMRNIVSRELILPSSTTSSIIGDIDSETFTPKEVHFEEIHSAYLQLPTYTFSRSEESIVVKAIEKDCLKVYLFYCYYYFLFQNC